MGLIYSKCSYFTLLSMCWGFVVTLQLGFQFFHNLLLEKTIPFLLNYLCILSKTSCLYLYRSVSEFSILFHWSLFFPQYHTVLIIVACFITLKLGTMNPLTCSFSALFWLSFSFHKICRLACWYIQNFLGFWLGLPWIMEKAMAAHSSVLAWRIPGMGEPGGLPSMGSHRVGHDWSDLVAAAALN